MSIPVLKGIANGYGLDESGEAMRGGKVCPSCGDPMSRKARLCSTCTTKFKNFLRKIYGYDVKTARAVVLTGGQAAAGRRNRQRTLETLRANGSTTTVDLARAMGMTAEGVRYQLKRMQETGEVLLVEGGYRHTWRANGQS